MKKDVAAVGNHSMSKDYFNMFDLKPDLDIDTNALEQKYLELQNLHHPDRHIGKSDIQRAQAEIQSATLNKAYQELKSPIRRLEIIIESNGYILDEIKNPPELLVEMMELSESLESNPTNLKLKKLDDEIERTWQEARKNKHLLSSLANIYSRLKYLENIRRECIATAC